MRGSLGCLLMGAFYFNTSTGQVEELEKKSQSKDLLGPYPTREAAADALRSARERTESLGRRGARVARGRPAVLTAPAGVLGAARG
nr:hypothetical protein [Angustibacter aerolatus]